MCFCFFNHPLQPLRVPVRLILVLSPRRTFLQGVFRSLLLVQPTASRKAHPRHLSPPRGLLCRHCGPRRQRPRVQRKQPDLPLDEALVQAAVRTHQRAHGARSAAPALACLSREIESHRMHEAVPTQHQFNAVSHHFAAREQIGRGRQGIPLSYLHEKP